MNLLFLCFGEFTSSMALPAVAAPPPRLYPETGDIERIPRYAREFGKILADVGWLSGDFIVIFYDCNFLSGSYYCHKFV